MTPEELMKAVDLTADEYIAEAAVPPAKHGIFGFNGAKAVFAAAACLVVFLLAGIVLKNNVPPTQTTPTTEDIPPVSETEDMTTENNEPLTTQKNTHPTEEPTTEVTVSPTQKPTESTEGSYAPISEPTAQTPSSEPQGPTENNNAPTVPPEQRTEETTTEKPAIAPPTETTTQPPAYKTLTEIIEEMGLLDETVAGEGQLLGEPDFPPEGTPAPVITELTAEELADVPGFVVPETMIPPDGFELDEFFAAVCKQDTEISTSAQYVFSSETDSVTVMAIRRDGMTLPETAKELTAENVNGTELYYTDNSPYKLTDEPNEYLAVFMTKGILYVVLGSGTAHDTAHVFELCKIFI